MPYSLIVAAGAEYRYQKRLERWTSVTRLAPPGAASFLVDSPQRRGASPRGSPAECRDDLVSRLGRVADSLASSAVRIRATRPEFSSSMAKTDHPSWRSCIRPPYSAKP
jgi:hypothetical protein